jgi:nicotinamide-nucleotide amidase
VTTAELLTFLPDPGRPADGGAAPALARLLERHGIGVRGRRLVSLEEGEAGRALRQAVEGGGLVVCLGDAEGAAAARQALAQVLGSRLVLSDGVLDALAAAYAARGQAMPRRAEALALVPHGATVLPAPPGGEPGLLAAVGAARVAVLPDAAEAATLLAETHLLPRLPRRAAEPATLVRTLRLVGLAAGDAEARLGAALHGVEDASARAVEVGAEVWVRLALRGATPAAVARRFDELGPVLRGALGAAWYGVDDETLPVVVGRLLRARGLTLALAESCTGGLVGSLLTDVPGSSAYVERGFVVYSNAAKQALLGVPDEVLARHGAVSAECAEAMARGARARAGTDLAVSVTGIAGPDGGTATKPVGLVFIGVADARGAAVERHRFGRDRAGNKALSALGALDLVRRRVLEPEA